MWWTVSHGCRLCGILACASWSQREKRRRGFKWLGKGKKSKLKAWRRRIAEGHCLVRRFEQQDDIPAAIMCWGYHIKDLQAPLFVRVQLGSGDGDRVEKAV